MESRKGWTALLARPCSKHLGLQLYWTRHGQLVDLRKIFLNLNAMKPMVSQSDQENSSSTLRTVFQLSPSPGADSKEQASLPPQPNPADRRGVKRRSETFMFTSLPPQFSTPLYNQRSTWISFNYVINIKNKKWKSEWCFSLGGMEAQQWKAKWASSMSFFSFPFCEWGQQCLLLYWWLKWKA